MRRAKLHLRIALVGALGGGMLLADNGCLNTLLSVQICGTVVPSTICTAQDQLALVFQYLQVPDFSIDPSCTIPFSCGSNQYPFGGGASVQPPSNSGGSGVTGGS